MIKISQKRDLKRERSGYAKFGERREELMVPFQYYLRQGCKNGTVPHIKSGGVYYVNVPALMEELDRKRK